MKKMMMCLILACLVIVCPGPMGQEESKGEQKNGADTELARAIKITMVRMERIGFYVERYNIDKGMYPDAHLAQELYNLAQLNYQLKLSIKDSWGNTFGYMRKQRKEGEGKSYYKIISPGPEGGDNEYIIYSNGFFIKYPEEFKYLFD